MLPGLFQFRSNFKAMSHLDMLQSFSEAKSVLPRSSCTDDDTRHRTAQSVFLCQDIDYSLRRLQCLIVLRPNNMRLTIQRTVRSNWPRHMYRKYHFLLYCSRLLYFIIYLYTCLLLYLLFIYLFIYSLNYYD